MIAEYFRKLFEYDYWGNREVITALQRCQNPPEKALKLLSHILAAETVWLTRLKGENSSALPIWPEYSLADCEKKTGKVFQNWMDFLEGLPAGQLEEKVHYKNSKGTPFETAAGDILTHVVIHGGYHRGQIAALLRQAGEQPPVTDYIVYVRDH